MTENTNPAPCEGCGEVHPPMTPKDAFQVLLGVVAQEAAKVVSENPGKFPALEEAVGHAGRAAEVVMLQELQERLASLAPQAAPAPAKAEEVDRGYGLYL